MAVSKACGKQKQRHRYGVTYTLEVPLFSGQVADLADVPPDTLHSWVRRRLVVAPPMQAGKRLWFRVHLEALAQALPERGRAVPKELRRVIRERQRATEGAR